MISCSNMIKKINLHLHLNLMKKRITKSYGKKCSKIVLFQNDTNQSYQRRKGVNDVRREGQHNTDGDDLEIVGNDFELTKKRQRQNGEEGFGADTDGEDDAQPIRVPTKREIFHKQRLGVSTSDASAVVQEQHAKRK